MNTTGIHNTAIGTHALYTNTTGIDNVAVGAYALCKNTIGTYNTALGRSALCANTTGSHNTAIGACALQSNTTGEKNVAVGYHSLRCNTTGHTNVAIGYKSACKNTIGQSNVSIGYQSFRDSTIGCMNVAIGLNSLILNTTGCYNTAIGSNVGYKNTTGVRNTYMGYQTGSCNQTGNDNVALGTQSLKLNTGSFNVAVGNTALACNTIGQYNVALGYESLKANTTGIDNVAIGTCSLYSNTTGSYNTAIGKDSLKSNTTGNQNIAIGRQALKANTVAIANTTVGYQSGYGITTSSRNVMMGVNTGGQLVGGAGNNTYIGQTAGYWNSAGSFNVALGADTLKGSSGSSFSSNTAIGSRALYAITSGGQNIGLGRNSGDNITTGSGNVIIGNVDATSATGDRQLKIAGYDGTNTTTWISGDSSGNIGIKQTSPTAGLHIGGNGTDNGSFKVNASDNSEWFGVSAGTVSFNMQGGSTKVAGATSLGARMNIAQLNSGTAALALAGGQANNILEINSANSDLGGDYLVVNQTGKVGIGTTSPSQALDVVGSIEVSDGIYIGGTGDANKLDDYEEGSHVVTMIDTGGGATITPHNSYKTLAYVKVGRLVHVQGVLLVSAISQTMTGTLRVSLPFASATISSGAGRSYLTLGAYNVDFTAGTSPYGAVVQGGSYFEGAVSGDNISGGQYRVTTSSQIYVAGSYYASA
jgi:hypothetical protein